ncbi:hypothetical protein BD770DRAFT_415243 [Pilaira anomala]|nr:hypothetical protein BD770DRAFT_415243 [Pilaira anomala]
MFTFIIDLPFPLETMLKELLAVADILFLAPMDHSSDMIKIFDQSTLNDVCNQVLGELMPANTAKINDSDFIKVTNTINAVDRSPLTHQMSQRHTLLLHPTFILVAAALRKKLFAALPEPRTENQELQIHPAAILELYLNDIWFSLSDDCPIQYSSYKALFVKDFFWYDSLQHQLLFRIPADPLRLFPRLGYKFRDCFFNHQIQFYSFFGSLLQPSTTVDPNSSPPPLTSSTLNKSCSEQFAPARFNEKIHRNELLSLMIVGHPTVDRISESLCL